VPITRIAIAGSTGYSGKELIKLLKRHGTFKVTRLIGREDSLDGINHDCDLAFLCTPNETSLELAPKLLAKGLHVVDVSGAFRLKQHDYKEWYGFEHSAKQWLQKSEYALNPWLKPTAAKGGETRLIANPGCYPTATLLAVLPLLKHGLIDSHSIVIDAKSGTSGAGKKSEPHLMFTELFGEYLPYKIGRHQHWPEIVEATQLFTGVKINPCFTTSLLPVERGISAAIYASWSPSLLTLSKDQRLLRMKNAFEESYKDCPDIRFGNEPELLSLKMVCHSNVAHLHFTEAFGRPVVFSSIDNLVRGAAGQALLNANLLAGLEAQEGLSL
jgi:N-acetyl-gamma-glutamyl-phosphate reductase